MQQQLEEPSTVDDRITVSALEETADFHNWEQIAALADEFWLRWNTRRGLVPTWTGNCQSKGQYEKETESSQFTKPSIYAAEVDTSLLRTSIRSRAAHAGASKAGLMNGIRAAAISPQ